MAISLAATAAESGVSFLDAPVSGGQIGAENGALTVMVGAEETAFEAAKPLITCYAKSIRRMGGVGTGQLTKMVNRSASQGYCRVYRRASTLPSAPTLMYRVRWKYCRGRGPIMANE